MNRNQELTQFHYMCQMVGAQATEEQVGRLVSHALEHFGTDDYGTIMNIGAEYGISELVTEFSMRKGEMGQ